MVWVGAILPDCGGAMIPDTGGGDEGFLPDVVMKQLGDHGKNGIVISGLVAWMEVQMDTEGCEIWRGLVERNWSETEVSQAKEALKAACGPLLETLVPDFKTKRQKKEKEIEDIRKAIVALQNSNSMPLILASSGMMRRCPPAWGQPATSTIQDVMGKVHMLEEVMNSHLETQRKQMDKLSQDITSLRGTGAARTVQGQSPRLDTVDTPTKKRKLGDQTEQITFAAVVGAQHGEAGAAGGNVGGDQEGGRVAGVQPLPKTQRDSSNILQQLLQQRVKARDTPRSPRNICFGSAKTSGEGGGETMLAANVDLVASGVGKDCTEELLGDFLKGKGIDAVEVVLLTREEILSEVRTKTFKVTVKPNQYEQALKPEVWPYRVAVRHFRAPKRRDTTWNDQSGRAGGQINRGPQQGQGQRQPQQSQRYLPVGHPQHNPAQHQVMAQRAPDPVQISNLFDLLGQLGSKELN